jgi:hypothetical protein
MYKKYQKYKTKIFMKEEKEKLEDKVCIELTKILNNKESLIKFKNVLNQILLGNMLEKVKS